MKNIKILFFLLSLWIANGVATAQELPVFTQKFSNSVFYNPALSGLTEGSIDLAFQNAWNGLDRKVNNSYFMAQAPLMDGSIGASLNFFNEKINLFNTFYVSGAGAYHLPINYTTTLSFGLQGEYFNNRIDLNDVRVINETDPLILNYPGYNGFDFTFGANLRSTYYSVGASMNRMINFFSSDNSDPSGNLFTEFATFQAAFYLPVANDRDVLEPRLNYRTVKYFENLLDIGVYYTYNDLLTVGGAYRTNTTYNVSAALHYDYFTIGYSRQSFANEYSNDVGSSDEIVLRYVFMSNDNVGYFGSGGPKKGKGFRLGGVQKVRADKPRKPITSRRERKKMQGYKGKYKKLKN